MTKEHQNNEDLYDWIDSLENLILFNGEDKTKAIIRDFIEHLKSKNLLSDKFGDMPFENTVSFDEQIEYPGDIGLEAKIRHFIRWNALVTVLRANKEDDLGSYFNIFISSNSIRNSLQSFFRDLKNLLVI